MNEYVGAVRELACEILDLVEEGLCGCGPNLQEDHHPRSSSSAVFSKLIRDANSDSCVRINRYPPVDDTNAAVITNPSQNDYYSKDENWDVPPAAAANNNINVNSIRVGFGEHSDPQILTILRSNDVPGLQICSPDGLWIPVSPEPDHLCVFVGDVFQVRTYVRTYTLYSIHIQMIHLGIAIQIPFTY